MDSLHLNTSKGYLLVTYSQDNEKGWILNSGDDRLDGGTGSDLLVGGDGVDTVVYSGALPSYKFLLTKSGEIKVADTANGTLDTLLGFELGAFNGQQVDIGFTQAAQAKLNTLGMLYQTPFVARKSGCSPYEMCGSSYQLARISENELAGCR